MIALAFLLTLEDARRPQDVVRSLHQQRSQIRRVATVATRLRRNSVTSKCQDEAV